MVALSSEAIWIQDTWQLRAIPLQSLGIEKPQNGKELVLTPGPETSAEKLTLAFASATDRDRFAWELRMAQQQVRVTSPHADHAHPFGVALVQRAPELPHVDLGRVRCTGRSQWAAERGLQLRAGMRGADAVIGVQRRKCPELGWAAREVTGLAVRVPEAADRNRLRQCWYGEEVGALAQRLLALLAIQAGLLLVVIGFSSSAGTVVNGATGLTPLQALAESGWWLGLLYAWPLGLLALLWVLRWPQLLRATGLAVLVATTGRGLTLYLAHLLAVGTTGVALADGKLWFLADPFDWAIIIAGVVLWLRARRLAEDAPQILPPELQAVAPARTAWSCGLLVLTAVYALVLGGYTGTARYGTTAHLLQPGVDPRREQQALLALNEGAVLANKGDLGPAEQSLQRALQLWEGLATAPSAPPDYRANLAMTLYDLGWIRGQQGRDEEAEQYYARVVALADGLRNGPPIADNFKQHLADAQRVLAELRSDAHRAQRATRALSQGIAQLEKGDLVLAEQSLQQSLRLWEELTAAPAASPGCWANRAVTLDNLGLIRQRQGKEEEAKKLFAAVVALAKGGPGGPPLDDKFREALAYAQKALADLRGDSQREQQALLAFTDGVAQLDKEEWRSAEQSFQRSLRLWEELNAAPDAPPTYRVKLADTLNNLGWTRQRQGRDDEAEKDYARVVALGAAPADGAPVDNGVKQAVTYAEKALIALRDGRVSKLLYEKDRAATHTCEEAQVKARKKEADAERLYQEAIALWEEVAPKATNNAHRTIITIRLATAYLQLGHLQQQLGKHAAARPTLTKAVEYGEKAVSLEPDRPLLKHNLELARQLLEGAREREFQEEIGKLCNAERFAEAVDRYQRSVAEQEGQVRSASDRDGVRRRLAYRLASLAWLLAHCADARVRNTNAAVQYALRATDLQPDVRDYRYTLALVQYRNGDWQDSLASLEKLRTRQGAFDALGWLLVAMNRHQLKQPDEARQALRDAIEWIQDQECEAEVNATLRYQYEMMRPRIEPLRREAENLMQGKDPARPRSG
jgi:tetratricopeptide (TPR) repeat protein